MTHPSSVMGGCHSSLSSLLESQLAKQVNTYSRDVCGRQLSISWALVMSAQVRGTLRGVVF